MQKNLRDYDIKEIRNIYRQEYHKVNRRISRIEAKGIETPATTKFRSLGVSMKTKGMSKDELIKNIQQIRYIDTLKSSSVKGAISYQQNYEQLNEAFNVGQIDRDKFFEIYGKLVEEMGIIQLYRYEVWEVMREAFGRTTNLNNVANAVKRFLDQNNLLPANETIGFDFYDVDAGLQDLEVYNDVFYHSNFNVRDYEHLTEESPEISEAFSKFNNPDLTYRERMEALSRLKTEIKDYMGMDAIVMDNKATEEEVLNYLDQTVNLDATMRQGLDNRWDKSYKEKVYYDKPKIRPIKIK